MPELSCEHPSREELQSYLNEHWQKTIGEINFFRDEFDFDCSRTYEKFYDSILKSLIRLNEFPREDKFWTNTNKKPTIFKLNEFCELKLKENPNDVLALWTKLSLIIINGQVEETFNEIIKKLTKDGSLNADILTEIYLAGDLVYDDDSVYFAEVLSKLKLENQAFAKLQLLKKSKNQTVSDWAETVLDKITRQ